MACVNTNKTLSLMLELFTIYGHGRAPRPARTVAQDVKRIDCHQYASDSPGKGKCDRLRQTPELVKPSTVSSLQTSNVPQSTVERHV